jgi:type I restriction enzyme, R subunit
MPPHAPSRRDLPDQRRQLLLDQVEESWIADGELSDQAHNNSIENFRLVFDRKFLQTIITRMDGNSEIFKRILDEEDFRDLLCDYYVKKVYGQLREAA